MFKKKIKIILVKEGYKDVIVTCPQSIKLGLWDLYKALRLDIPALNVRPVNFWSVLFLIFLYALIFLTFFIVIAFPGTISFFIFGGVLVANILINRNYYWNLIHKKLLDGYKPTDKETWKLLEEAKMPNNLSWNIPVVNPIISVNRDLPSNQI